MLNETLNISFSLLCCRRRRHCRKNKPLEENHLKLPTHIKEENVRKREEAKKGNERQTIIDSGRKEDPK